MSTTEITAEALSIGLRVEDNDTDWAEVTDVVTDGHLVRVSFVLADGTTETMRYHPSDRFGVLPR